MAIRDDFFRCSSRKLIGGVCAGIADFMDTSIALIRLLFILSFLLFSGIPILVYIGIPSDKETGEPNV